MRGIKVKRIYREVRVNAIGGCTEEIMKDLVSRQMGREEARVPGICLPSPGGGGSIAKRSGWGDGLPTRALFEGRDGHPTPPLISFASTLPLQGRVRSRTPRNDERE